MADYVILTDTNCDLGKDLQARFNIEIINAHLKHPDNTEHDSFLSWDEITMEEFYKNLKKNPKGWSTAPANVTETALRFEKIMAEGKDVLFITISSALSGTYNFGMQAKAQAEKKYPGRKAVVVDSLRFASGLGLVVMYASMKRSEGLSIEENAAWLEENRQRIHQCGWLDDLSFVAASGRMNHGKAFFGTLAGIKPIGEQNENGLTTVIAKAKGTKQGYPALIGFMKETIENPEDQIILIANSNRRKQAEEFRKLIEEEVHPKEIYVKDVFPSSGVNVGPGLMAAYYVGRKITKDLAEEAAIYEKYLGK